MASLSPTWCYQGGVLRHPASSGGRPCNNHFQTSLLVSFSARHREHGSQENRRALLLPCLRCQKDDDEEHIRHISVERPPYNAYLDSSSGEMQPAFGARHAIPPEICWPEGTKDRVRAAQAPKPTGDSTGSPSYGQQPGSRRKNYKASAAGSESSGESYGPDDPEVVEIDEEEEATDETDDFSSDYVSYETEPEEPTGYALDKKLGRPHPFVDPEKRRKVDGTLTNDELWWNWRKPKKEIWSRWQRRKPDVDTVFLKAMVETGQVKIFGEEPTIAEAALYRSRKHLYKEERLEAEQEKLESIGPLAYYSEWVSAWKKDTSREAIQKHFEETGEDETTQLIEMFCHQTDREFRIMMGTDLRIKRDPLAMRMREDQIKQIWGGDPVYPTINYVQDPNEVADYRGPDFHEPTPNMLDFLKEHGKIITREEIQKIIAEEEPEEVETADTDEAMARAVDIGETEDKEENAEVDTGVAAQDDVAVEEQEQHEEAEVGLESESDEEEEEEEEGEGEDEKEEKVKKKKTTRDWSVQKTNPQTAKKKGKSKKGDMSLDQAIDDSENLTDFLMDFDEEEQ